jgi:hypothetical protein
VLDARLLVGQLSPIAENVGPPLLLDKVKDFLPPLHRELLVSLNGFTVQRGTLRLFGVGRGDDLDLDWWNREETWKFAWDDRVSRYLFFAATAWGDQYAYRLTDGGGLEPTVYFLEGTLLRPQPLSESFSEFAEKELLRVADSPYDSMTVKALATLGPIKPFEQWVFAPSIALGAEESLDNVVCLRSNVGMTFAGDIASALRASVPGSNPTAVEPWEDDQGRQRLRVKFDR